MGLAMRDPHTGLKGAWKEADRMTDGEKGS